ncbi:MAG: DUF503 domain-containing protein [Deltaproteobacteria bacterium]|nr:DUF503 domain-containing protein [Deltaproteobacteria bacterium]
MVVGILKLELYLPIPQSLKEKRSIVKRVLGRIRVRFPISAAEVDHFDLWQRSMLGIVMVDQNEADIHTVFTKLEKEVIESAEVEISNRKVEFQHF